MSLVCHVRSDGWASLMHWPNKSGEVLHMPVHSLLKRLSPSETEAWFVAVYLKETDSIEVGDRIAKPEGWEAFQAKRGVRDSKK